MDFKAIKKLRNEKNMTQKQLSERSGIGVVTISRMETGILREANVGTLLKLSNALECDIRTIINASSDEQKI